jgi:hypothetical protein
MTDTITKTTVYSLFAPPQLQITKSTVYPLFIPNPPPTQGIRATEADALAVVSSIAPGMRVTEAGVLVAYNIPSQEERVTALDNLVVVKSINALRVTECCGSRRGARTHRQPEIACMDIFARRT